MTTALYPAQVFTDSVETEIVSCPLCDGKNFSVVATGKDFEYTTATIPGFHY
jgi:4-hydroxy-3-methylbut-2-en-1-yl diphosphate synthase IspG/GcpE